MADVRRAAAVRFRSQEMAARAGRVHPEHCSPSGTRCFSVHPLSLARGRKLDASDSTITARVGSGPRSRRLWLDVALACTRRTCRGASRRSDASRPRALPYSNATRATST